MISKQSELKKKKNKTFPNDEIEDQRSVPKTR